MWKEIDELIEKQDLDNNHTERRKTMKNNREKWEEEKTRLTVLKRKNNLLPVHRMHYDVHKAGIK